jgi:hypothetical protein
MTRVRKTRPQEEVVEDSPGSTQAEILEQVVELYGGPELEPEGPEVRLKEMEVLEMLDKLKLDEEMREDSNNRLLAEIARGDTSSD